MRLIGSVQRLFWPAATLWALALPAAAASVPTGNTALSSRLLAGMVYATGAVLCHQRPERSFAWGGHSWPVFARCTGIYAGAAGASLLIAGMNLRRRRTAACRARGAAVTAGATTDVRRTRIVVLLALAPSLLTLAWEWRTGTAPSNVLRALAGLPIGVVVAWVVLRLARADAQSG